MWEERYLFIESSWPKKAGNTLSVTRLCTLLKDAWESRQRFGFMQVISFFWNTTFDLESQLLMLPRLRKRRYIPALLPFSNFPISKWYSIDLLGRSQKLRLQLEDLPDNWQLITYLSLAARKVDTFVCYFKCRKFYYYGRKSHWGATNCYQSIA